jgi:hypothetical protein
MKKILFLLLLIPLMLTPAFSQSLITFDVDTTKFTPGEIVELHGTVQSGLEGQPVAVEIKDADGTLILIRTVTSDGNGEFSLKFKVPSNAAAGEFDIITNMEIDGDTISEITSADESGVTENIIVSAISNEEPTVQYVAEPTADTKPNCGTGTVEKDGVCVVDVSAQTEKVVAEEKSSEGGGCLIATATYGSELAPQVQQLRELRDNQLLQTASGTAFMGMFNNIYYSFSPIIADYERENPLFKEVVKIAITPMISSLSLMENAESESEVLGIGLSVIALNLGMYLGVPAVVIVGIRKRI